MRLLRLRLRARRAARPRRPGGAYVAALRAELAGGWAAAGGRAAPADAAAPRAPRFCRPSTWGAARPRSCRPTCCSPWCGTSPARLEAPRSGRDAAPAPDSLARRPPSSPSKPTPAPSTPLLALLAEAGVTRLSLGVQSFAPALRAALGRRVTDREVEAALEAISGHRVARVEPRPGVRHPGADLGRRAGRHRRRRGGGADAHLSV